MNQHRECSTPRTTITIQERYRDRMITVTVAPDAPSRSSVNTDLWSGIAEARTAIDNSVPKSVRSFAPCSNLDPEEWSAAS